jgi:hypothetical protein
VREFGDEVLDLLLDDLLRNSASSLGLKIAVHEIDLL